MPLVAVLVSELAAKSLPINNVVTSAASQAGPAHGAGEDGSWVRDAVNASWAKQVATSRLPSVKDAVDSSQMEQLGIFTSGGPPVAASSSCSVGNIYSTTL